MHWQRLNRDGSLKVIESVKSTGDPGLFSPVSCEVERGYLPFYKDVFLYRITNYASLPSFTFEYLGDGTFFHHMDGTEGPILTVNDKALDLNEFNVVPYLAFYFSQVGDDDGDDVIVVKDPQDMPLLDSLGPESLRVVMKNHRPAEVSFDEATSHYLVKTDLFVGGQLLRAEIDVNLKGRVKVGSQKMIVNALQGALASESV